MNVTKNDVLEFIEKYGKHSRFIGKGEERVKEMVSDYYNDIKKYGYTLITKHSTASGDTAYLMADGSTAIVNDSKEANNE